MERANNAGRLPFSPRSASERRVAGVVSIEKGLEINNMMYASRETLADSSGTQTSPQGKTRLSRSSKGAKELVSILKQAANGVLQNDAKGSKNLTEEDADEIDRHNPEETKIETVTDEVSKSIEDIRSADILQKIMHKRVFIIYSTGRKTTLSMILH
jgi:hypothetical protein